MENMRLTAIVTGYTPRKVAIEVINQLYLSNHSSAQQSLTLIRMLEV